MSNDKVSTEIEQKEVNEENSTLCSIPWNHLVIQQNGNYRACCQCISYPYGILTDTNNAPMNILTHTTDEARNSGVLKKIRAEMIKGNKPEACNLCWKEEDLGFSSRRLHVKKMFKDPDLSGTKEDGEINIQEYPLQYMDLRFGNLCNQACRSCSPTDSSLWYEEWSQREKGFLFYGRKYYSFKNKGSSINLDSDDFLWYNQPNFEVEFRKNLSNIKRLYFTGGEPTINKAHFNTLQICIDEGVARNISLDYNSNLMSIPDHLLEKWKNFASINIGASIDAIGDLANYVRYPSSWDNIEKNLLRLDQYPFTNKVNLVISTTVSILNVLNFLDLTEWSLTSKTIRLRKTPSYHMLHGPLHLNIQILPDETKDMIKQKYEDFFVKLKELGDNKYDSVINYYRNIITFMYESKGDTQALKKFFSTMFKSDLFRKQDLFLAIPWLQDTWRNMNEKNI